MNDPVLVGTLGMALSMGAIVVAGFLGGLLCFWLDRKIDHGHH